MSIGQMPFRIFHSLFTTKWTKERISWAIAYIYTLYVALGALPPFRGMITFSVATASFLLVILYIFHSYSNLNLRNASKFLIIAATISFIWEFIGVTTGIPFGQYVYTSALGPQLGPVPLFIPLIWCALGYFCMEASDYYIMASALMVSLDLSFDPVFSNALGLWTWLGPTQYFGVPLSNFFGWFVASLTFFAVFFFTSKRQTRSSMYAIVFYYLFGLDNVVGDLVSGSVALAIASFIIFTLATAIIFWVHRINIAKTMQGVQSVSAPSQPGTPL
jgi:uncharacterized membrane protein